MNTQTSPSPADLRALSPAAAPVRTGRTDRTDRTIGPGQALHLGARGGELTVLSGSVWLTRRSDGGDHQLRAGQHMHLAPNDQAVVESWDASATASIRWQPRYRSFPAALLAEPLHVLAFLAGRLAAGCASLSQRAAARARWAEGRRDSIDRPATVPRSRA